MYEGRGIQLRPNVPPQLRERAQNILRGYYAHIAALDDCLERLLTTLDRTGTAEDTIIVFTSDHGDMMLSQGLTTKLYPWDESIRIPFLLRYPARFGNRSRRLQTPLNAPDVMPTLLGACGLPVPASVQGTDFSSARDNSNAAALLSLPVPSHEARRYGFAEYRGLRTARYTYVRSIDGPWLLYDNQRDPFQKHNLVNTQSAAELKSRLDGQLAGTLKEVGDEFLPAAEYVRRASVGHYREVNVPIGTTRSPWGDWESTLKPTAPHAEHEPPDVQ
jgi:arylsulfatase A-like enzyme